MRKKKVIKRHQISPDRRFFSTIVSQLINKVMKNGEKRKAVNIVYKAADLVEKATSAPFLSIFEEALKNVKPELETKSRKFGGSNQRIPVKVGEKRSLTLALRWIVQGSREKDVAKPMFVKLADEINDAFNKAGVAFKKKENIHKEAAGNMAFAR